MPGAPGRSPRGGRGRVGRLAGRVVVATMVATAASWSPVGAAAPLDELASTLGGLKASLSAIREQMEAMRATPDAAALDGAALDKLCGAPPAAGEDARLADADRRHAVAAMTGELIDTRERLAAAEGAAATLWSDRERLVKRITELDRMLQEARTETVIDGLADDAPLPVEANGRGARRSAATPELLRVARPALAGEAFPAAEAGGRDLVRAGQQLDLQAELALAQLRIAELNAALEAARLRQEAMAAEVTTLRALTDGQILRFMNPQQ